MAIQDTEGKSARESGTHFLENLEERISEDPEESAQVRVTDQLERAEGQLRILDESRRGVLTSC